MSRLDKTISEKHCKKKYKSICRSVFLIIMVILTVSSVFLVDYRINQVLGTDSKSNLIKYLSIF